ncbi:MAG: hypothetical protein JO048_14795 [Methylobacteriaceae bacterium]|nr:hypothetical protein [Methylobacteriaceae bacterium]
MALDGDKGLGSLRSLGEAVARDRAYSEASSRPGREQPDNWRQNAIAFVLGGAAVVGALGIFLYYDPDDRGSARLAETGSIGRLELSAPATTGPETTGSVRPFGREQATNSRAAHQPPS